MRKIKQLKTIFLFLLGFCFVLSANAQQKTVTGTVTADADGMALPGVNVIVKGTTTGASTDFDGNYSINVNGSDAVLSFSYIGYVTKDVVVGSKSSVNVSLTEDLASLDEVVVVGYGTRKKSHLTGAVAKIGGDDVAAVQTARVDEALSGKLSGVLIQNQSGQPGAAPKIQIRAASSVNGNSAPLVVVDGYPISGSIATINPNDIESLEVLKDAASAAIYGSLGANGVVLVTTKKGKSGKAKFSYNTYVSTSSRYSDHNVNPTAGEWADTIDRNIANGTWDVSGVDPTLLNYRINAFRNSPDVVATEDWLFQNGNSQSHDFSMSGGTEDVKFFGSLGYQNTDGVVRTQNYERLNARMNIDANIGTKIKTGLNFNGFKGDQVSESHDIRDLLRAYSVTPIYHTEESIAFVQQLDQEAQSLGYAAFDDGYRGGARNAPFNSSIYTLEVGDYAHDWHYGRSGNGIGGTGDAGPAAKLDEAELTQTTYFANISTYLDYEIIEGLNLKTVLGADITDTRNYYYQGLETDSQGRLEQTDLDNVELKKRTWLSTTTLNYSKVIDKHDISAIAGLEYVNTYFDGISTVGTNVPFGPIVNYNLLDPASITVTETEAVESRRSVFGRIAYAYDDRYLVSASIRRDGNSIFGANQRFATFPAVSLGWNVHNEAFWEPISETISTFKPRFSTGSLGTSSFLTSYQSLSLLNAQATVFGTGFLIPNDVENADLTWQTNTETNYGIDLGFINNRIRLGVDYYTSDIEDILINQSVSEVLGTSSVALNSGDVRSSGLELELSAGVIRNDNFTWDVNANFSTVDTEITDLGNLDELPRQIYGQSGRGPVFRNYVGGGIGEMWGIETLGAVEEIYVTDPTRNPGINSSAFYVKDQQSPGEDGFGVIDKTRTVEEGGDLVKIGQNTPDFYWGLSSSMNYKNFDLSFQLQGVHGGEVWNVDPIYWNSEFGGRVNTDRIDGNGDGLADNNGLPWLDSNNQLDAQIQDASYVALRNLTIGYTVNADVLSKVGIDGVRIYAAATNLLYLWGDDYTSFNPEGVDTSNTGYAGPTTYGVQTGESPVVRSFTFGLNVNF
ncbi:TonB-dependent receptor [Algibacter sp.]|nr:TonB-dependent receptor [Algibacter sp.]